MTLSRARTSGGPFSSTKLAGVVIGFSLVYVLSLLALVKKQNDKGKKRNLYTFSEPHQQ